ncbi:hypothetical protein [Puia dinghuensis]|uniref:Uncharacterized protein n=1 Tax=Puia dinghuensis TaxID=1792502 RepID=A0A8J2XQX8_9BACT|nr:hypothetical protein [Puia dinghuensis]GGA84752.1 hypothetical protein GCM10011511_04730 [Puia dinghuensis]
MRNTLLILVLVGATLTSHSQTPNTVINCWIDNGGVNYGHLAELLPDSITANLLVNPRKKFHMRDGNVILLWLEQQGWKLLAVDVSASGSGGNVFSRSNYILSKEIYLDDAARTLFLQKLEGIENKRNN